MSKMTFFKWLTKKPKFDSECMVICGHKYKKKDWEYNFYLVKKVESDEGWYFGWFYNGDEYDDLAEMTADIYYVLPLVTGDKKQFKK